MTENLDVALGKLQESVKNLSDREQEHHATVLAELKDIKENINPRLTALENTAFMKSDFNQFYTGAFATLGSEVQALKSFKNKLAGGLILLNIIWGALLALAIAYFQGHA